MEKALRVRARWELRRPIYQSETATHRAPVFMCTSCVQEVRPAELQEVLFRGTTEIRMNLARRTKYVKNHPARRTKFNNYPAR